MKLSIFSIRDTLFEGQVERVTLPTLQGDITVLDRHIPLVTTIKPGAIRYYIPQQFESGWHTIQFPGGIVEVRPGSEVVVLANE